MSTLKWWGYLHTNGSIQVKRYFGPEDIAEAFASPFVQRVVREFDAEDRDCAVAYIKRQLGL